jgi:hypothetical protein
MSQPSRTLVTVFGDLFPLSKPPGGHRVVRCRCLIVPTAAVKGQEPYFTHEGATCQQMVNMLWGLGA